MPTTSIAAAKGEPVGDAYGIARAIEAARTEQGSRLVDLLESGPLLLVFLRHAGCTFCREAISDIAETRAAIEADGTRIVLVHLGDQKEIERVVARYGVADLERIADPERVLYRAFGLKRGGGWALYGPKVLWRALVAGWWCGHGVARPAADATQMPGVFRIDKGMVVSRYRHQSAADRPCYIGLCEAGLKGRASNDRAEKPRGGGRA